MNTETILRLAKEAGFRVKDGSKNVWHPYVDADISMTVQLTKFAELLLEEAEKPLLADAVPEGWKLVPIEPTEEMVEAMTEAWCRNNHGEPYDSEIFDIYGAAIAATPKD